MLEPSSEALSFSPPVVVTHLDFSRGKIHVVRDDLLTGGTKQRACKPFLDHLKKMGFIDFYYASPFAGFAQVALAYTAKNLSLKCHLVCEKDQTQAGRRAKHEFTLLAESFGAKIYLVDSLSEASQMAFHLSANNPKGYVVPLGFNCEEFRRELKREIGIQWSFIQDSLKMVPKRLWLPVGSGTLASVFQEVISSITQLLCVNVHVLKGSDSRIQNLKEKSQKNQNLKLYSAPEKFSERAGMPPDLPSNIHYDAKLWRMIEAYGEDGDVWWNVAR